MRSKKTAITFIASICACILLIISALFWAIGIHEPSGFASVTDPVAYYSQAADKIEALSDIRYTVSDQQIMYTAQNTFKTSLTQDIIHLSQNFNAPQLYTTEELKMGAHIANLSVAYTDGTLYHTVNGSGFMGKADYSALCNEYAPALLLNADNYQTVQGLNVGDSTVIHFSDPKAPENWTNMDTDFFQGARATAWLDHTGNLMKSSYSYYYTNDTVTVYRCVTVQITDTDPAHVSLPAVDEYQAVSDPWLPRLLETACGQLLQATAVTASHRDTITCELFGDTRQQDIDIDIQNDTDDPSVSMKTTVTITNSSREGEATISTQLQHYLDGNYTHTIDGNVVTEAPGISAQELLKRCREIMVGTILLPYHIQDAVISNTDSTYRIEFSANADFVAKIVSDACSTLYGEPMLLDELAADHQTDVVLCYLEFDTKTDLPLSSGIHYSGTYRVSDLPYKLIFEADQHYTIP